ncbi:hypothetical protein AD998_03550 [bacterium 336/3]|nr:hypothetical protein AD998_03550 [bacterium 336/3]
MLPKILKGSFDIFKSEKKWIKYLKKIGDLAHIDHDFLSQICCDHFERFNNRFPKFDLKYHKIIRIKKNTREIYDFIRYDRNEIIDFWYFQIDDFLEKGSRADYEIISYIAYNKTWHFPPVVIDAKLAIKIGVGSFGSPIHLIEGTHRVSFLRRLYELNLIKDDAEHELLYITEMET